MLNIKKYPNPDPNGRPLIDCKICGERTEHHAKKCCFNCYRRLAWERKKIICKDCNERRYHKALGLCSGCYTRKYFYEDVKANNAKKKYGIDLDLLREVTKKCVICEFSKIVELHHLDGDRKNSDKKNLIGLCPNCHRMIHSYKHINEIKESLNERGYNTSNIKPNRGRLKK